MVAAKGLTVHRPKSQPWLGPLLLDIAYDYLDAESLDYVRALWRLRRIRKSKARHARDRTHLKNLLAEEIECVRKQMNEHHGLVWTKFGWANLYTAYHRAEPNSLNKAALNFLMDEQNGRLPEPADLSFRRRVMQELAESGRALPTPVRNRSRGGLSGSYNTATPETLFHTTSRPAGIESESINSRNLTLRGDGVGLFSGVSLKDVKVGGGKAMDFKGEGDFVVKVTEVKGGETRKREKYFEVIHEVVESTIPEIQPIGSKTNLFCMLQGSGQDLGLQNMKEILCTLSGLNPHSNADADKIAQISDEEWIKIAELACSDPKTFGGTLVNVSVTQNAVKQPKPGGRTHYLRRRYTPNEKTVAPKAKAGK